MKKEYKRRKNYKVIVKMHKTAQNCEKYFENNIQTSRDLQKSTCNRFVNVLFSNYSNGNVTGNNTETVSDNLTGV